MAAQPVRIWQKSWGSAMEPSTTSSRPLPIRRTPTRRGGPARTTNAWNLSVTRSSKW